MTVCDKLAQGIDGVVGEFQARSRATAAASSLARGEGDPSLAPQTHAWFSESVGKIVSKSRDEVRGIL